MLLVQNSNTASAESIGLSFFFCRYALADKNMITRRLAIKLHWVPQNGFQQDPLENAYCKITVSNR